MNIRWYIIIVIFTFTLFSVGSYALTRAYFTHTVVSADHTFKTAESFDTVTEPSGPDETIEDTTGGIVINEVFESSDNSSEWIELHNTSDGAIDISNWKISDNDSSEILPTTNPIPSGGYAVIVTDPTDISDVSEDSIVIVLTGTGKGAIGNGLAKGGDKVVLTNEESIVIDQVSWGSDKSVFNPSFPPPTNGKTLQRISNEADTDTIDNWKTGDPTPGGANN